jgi:hypothetical protein
MNLKVDTGFLPFVRGRRVACFRRSLAAGWLRVEAPVKASRQHGLEDDRMRNPLRAGLVARAQAWRWSSLWRRERGPAGGADPVERLASAAAPGVGSLGVPGAERGGSGGVAALRRAWLSVG